MLKRKKQKAGAEKVPEAEVEETPELEGESEGGELKIAATYPFTRFREKVKPQRKQRYNRQAEKRVAPDE